MSRCVPLRCIDMLSNIYTDSGKSCTAVEMMRTWVLAKVWASVQPTCAAKKSSLKLASTLER